MTRAIFFVFDQFYLDTTTLQIFLVLLMGTHGGCARGPVIISPMFTSGFGYGLGVWETKTRLSWNAGHILLQNGKVYSSECKIRN